MPNRFATTQPPIALGVAIAQPQRRVEVARPDIAGDRPDLRHPLVADTLRFYLEMACGTQRIGSEEGEKTGPLLDRVPEAQKLAQKVAKGKGFDQLRVDGDYLATALYVDHDDLFTGFVTWTAEILEARGVPGASLRPALDLLAERGDECVAIARALERYL